MFFCEENQICLRWEIQQNFLKKLSINIKSELERNLEQHGFQQLWDHSSSAHFPKSNPLNFWYNTRLLNPPRIWLTETAMLQHRSCWTDVRSRTARRAQIALIQQLEQLLFSGTTYILGKHTLITITMSQAYPVTNSCPRGTYPYLHFCSPYP